jgi:hypothetical protein
MAEFYFDYTLRVLKNELDLPTDERSMPKLYLERDYSTENVNYVMYVTFPQWSANNKPKNTRMPYGFTGVKLIYDVGAVGVDTVVNVTDKRQAKMGGVEVFKEITFTDYANDGHRCVILTDEENCSGVGKIILTSEGRETIYFVAVNFEFKKKIRYSISGSTLFFEESNYSRKFRIKVCVSSDRGGSVYPCTKDYITESAQGSVIDVYTYKKPFQCSLPENYANKPVYLCFDPKDEEVNKHFLLECTSNSTLGMNGEVARQDIVLFCPYCHSVIKNRNELKSKSHHGGVGCDGRRFVNEGGKRTVTVMEGKNRKKPAKQAFFCSHDFRSEGENLKMPDDSFDLLRTLPDDFFDRNHFKVIVMGSKRAGKTTFISRLFGIRGSGEDTELHGDTISYGTKKLVNLNPYSINCLRIVSDPGSKKIVTSKDSWYKKNHSFYSAYSIDINKGIYPGATNTAGNAGEVDKKRDITKTPFIMEVNKKDYVYFYDMAGEDAQRSTEFIKTLIGSPDDNQPVAIFYLVDSLAEKEDTLSVSSRIKEVLSGRKNPCPVSVILTKFDAIEDKFDDNCHCLRSNANDMMARSYENSDLEKNVDFASEEICSYLSMKGINPDFGEAANVKYFGVSAFSSPDAIYHESQKGTKEEVNYLLHSSSPKRMELPIIWTLRQFGCIT